MVGVALQYRLPVHSLAIRLARRVLMALNIGQRVALQRMDW
jgi:hypothetical protein